MIGQDIPPLERLPHRLPTSIENDQWKQAQRLIADLSDYVVALKMLGMNSAQTFFFAQSHGINMSKPVELEARVLELEAKIKRVRELMRKVTDRDLALQFVNGDIDIVDHNQQLSGVVLIITGVVVLAGLIGTLIYYKKEADDIRPRYHNLLAATDKVFCKQGSPKTCSEWTAYKKESGYTNRRTMADTISDSIGKPAKTGLQWGIAIAIPLIALFVASKFGDK